MYAKVKSWAISKNITLQGFAGYKAGMTHITIKDMRTNSITKGESVVYPVTVIECPPIKILSIRLYKNAYGGHQVATEIFNTKINKELARKINIPKKQKDIEEQLKNIEKNLSQITEVRAIVYTQPIKSGLGKKTPEDFEITLIISCLEIPYSLAS